MEAWLEAAVQQFPELKKYYVNPNDVNDIYIESPTELWLDLEGWFYASIDKGDLEFQKRVLSFLRLCTSGTFGDESSPIQQAIFCGFLWSIGRHQEVWSFLPKWFADSEFQQFFPEISYGLSQYEKNELQSSYEKYKA
ncbi:MAG: hypothetical protein Q7S46_06280 [Gallionella sp.]|nr:hypothetical protein [Gallionella sp.]